MDRRSIRVWGDDLEIENALEDKITESMYPRAHQGQTKLHASPVSA